MRPRLAVLSLLLLAVVLAWTGDHRAGGNSAAQAPSPKEKGVASRSATDGFTVATTDLNDTFVISGELRAAQSREIFVPRIQSGFASTVTFLAPEGSRVKKGGRILEFDGASLLTQKSEAERKLDEARLKISKTRTDLNAQGVDLLNELAQAEANLEVAQLYGRIGKELLPANQYQKYQLDLEKAQLALEKVRERLQNHESSVAAQLALVELERAQAELELKKTESDLSLLSVEAPQDGIIIYGDNWANNRKVQIGDTLFPGMGVLTLPDLSTLQVIGYVYDTELRNISPGMECEVRLDSVPGKSWKGRIGTTTSVASRKGFASQHKVFRAAVDLRSIDLGVMKPGMTARIELAVRLASDTAAVPREFLGLDEQGLYYVLKGADAKSASPQIVETGVFNERLVQILAGLKPGERVFPVRPGSGARP